MILLMLSGFLNPKAHFPHLRKEAVGYRGQTNYCPLLNWVGAKEAFSPMDLLHEPRRLLG